MENDLQPGDLDHLVKGVRLGEVGHDGDNKVARGGLRRVRLSNLGSLLLGANRRHDAVPFGEELLQDVGWGPVNVSVNLSSGLMAADRLLSDERIPFYAPLRTRVTTHLQ